jgi:hypothetical protein
MLLGADQHAAGIGLQARNMGNGVVSVWSNLLDRIMRPSITAAYECGFKDGQARVASEPIRLSEVRLVDGTWKVVDLSDAGNAAFEAHIRREIARTKSTEQ